jgi:nitroreductase
MTQDRLSMPLGEAIFTQRAIRRVHPTPIPEQTLRDILEAATRAPSGGNTQPWHFLVVTDPDLRRRFADLYRESWLAFREERGSTMPEAERLSREIAGTPAIVLVCATHRGSNWAESVIPATQNLLLAARALGVGGTITELHPTIEARVHALFDIPNSVQIVYCLPLGYPRGNFGPTSRHPVADVASHDRWSNVPDWLR